MVPFTTTDTSNHGHIKPQTRQTPDTSNPRHIKPQNNIELPTTQQIKIPFHISIEILFENKLDFHFIPRKISSLSN